jgi:integrase/recombinase XerD
MLKSYPKYERGSTKKLRDSLDKKTKKIFDDYMSFLSMSAGKRKMIDYDMYFLQFVDIMKPKKISNLKPQDFVDFWALVNQDDSREVFTKNTIKVTAKRFLKWYYSDNIKMYKVLDKLKLKSQVVNGKKINKQNLITEDEIRRMLRATHSIRDKAQLVTQYNTASRPSELRLAKWKDVDWDKKTIHIFSSKTDKPRELPLGNAVDHLKRWHIEFSFEDVQEDDYIFPSIQDRSKPMHDWTFRYNIQKLGEKAGIKRNFNPYMLRHGRLTEIYKKGVTDQFHKLFAGHSTNSKMTGVYVQMDDEDMIKSVIDKVYKIQELSDGEKNIITELAKRVDYLEREFGGKRKTK